MRTQRARKVAPGPPGRFLVGHLPEMRRDVLRLLLDSAIRYGDVVRLKAGPLVVHLLSHPDHIKHVLQDHRDNYQKTTRGDAYIAAVVGQSLLTTNGDDWQERRRQIQPAFHHERIAAFLPVMSEAVAGMLERWEATVAQAGTLDVASEMMRVTYAIVGKTLFGGDLGREAEAVEQAMTVVIGHTYGRLERVFSLPAIVPTPENRRFRAALRTLDEIVYRVIRARRRDGGEQADLLGMLMHMPDSETGEGMSDRQVRNEALTLLSAGHETTANALTWMWYLLSRHPEVEGRLHAELAAVLGGRPPSLADLLRLRYTTMVIKEAMRLYPPIWIMERKVISDDEIGGYHIPAGSEVTISPYVMHRHPAFWDDPARFDPERFAEGGSAGRGRYTYLPFGGGPRLCIGHHFAMLEAQVITAMMAQAYRLRLVPGHPVEPRPWITLRPRHGLLMTLDPREREEAGGMGARAACREEISAGVC